MNKTFPGDAVSQFQKYGRPRGEFQSREVRPLSGMVGEAIYNDPAASFMFGGFGDALDTSSSGAEVSAGQLGWAGLDVLGVVPGGGAATGAAAKLGAMAAKEVGTFIGATILPIMKTDAVRVAALELWDKIVRATNNPRQATLETGVHRDWQGVGKYQISDADSSISPEYIEMAQNWTPGTKVSTNRQLKNVYIHSDLYQVQPELGIQNTVTLTNKAAPNSSTHLAYAGYTSKFDDSGRFTGGEIRINPQGVQEYARLTGQSFEEAFLEMVNHETNHAVQAANYLPSGANEAWFATAKAELPVYKDTLKKKGATWKALSAKERLSPEGLKLGKEVTDLYLHTNFLQSIKKIDDGWLYQQVTGEADAFWSAAMRKNPNVAYILPEYLDPEAGRMLIQQYGAKAEGANAGKKQFRLYKPEHAAYFEPNRKAKGNSYTIAGVLDDPEGINPNYSKAAPNPNEQTKNKALAEQVERKRLIQPIPDEENGVFGALFGTSKAPPTTAQAAVQRLEERDGFGPKGGPVNSNVNVGHMSPYEFDTPDLSKIKTGQGANTFGYGFYVFENPATGKFYEAEFKNIKDSVKARKSAIQSQLNQPRGVPEWKRAELQRELEKANQQLSTMSDKVIEYSGNISDDLVKKDMFSWDIEYISRDPSKVLDRMDGKFKQDLQQYIDANMGFEAPEIGDLSGQQFYQVLTKYAEESPLPNIRADIIDPQQAATEYLSSLGIKGHKYLDGGSRKAGKGTYNYVVYEKGVLQDFGKRKLPSGGGRKPQSGPINNMEGPPIDFTKKKEAKQLKKEETLAKIKESVRKDLDAVRAQQEYKKLGITPEHKVGDKFYIDDGGPRLEILNIEAPRKGIPAYNVKQLWPDGKENTVILTSEELAYTDKLTGPQGGGRKPQSGPTSLVDLPSKVYRAVEEGTENFAVNVPRELGRHVGADRKIAENVENIGKGNNKTMKIVEYDKPKNSINVEDPVQIWWPHVSVKQLLASKDNLSAQAKNTLVEIRDNWFKSLEDLNKKYDTQKFSVAEYGDMKDDLSGEFSKKIARVLQDEGYDSVKYMNNAPDEFKGATDRTNYILLNKKD